MVTLNRMHTPAKFWRDFKSQPDIWFFYLFVLVFTLTIRKVLFFYPISGQFNEYTGIYLYLSDIFLILAVFFWIFSLIRQKIKPALLFSNVPRGTKIILQIILFLVIWSFISILWSDNQNIAIFRSFKLLEFFLLFIFVLLNVPRGTFFRSILQIVIGVSIFQSIIGIWQFILQNSLGFTWLHESNISPIIPGVAKIILDGEKYIRSYGLFPHPNIFGGFLVFSILATLLYSKIFHVEQKPANQGSTFYSTLVHQNNVSRETLWGGWNISRFFRFFIIVQCIALLLTFSKSAFIGLAIALVYLLISRLPTNRTHKIDFNLDLDKMFHMEHFRKKLLILTAILVLLVIILKPDFNSLVIKSLDERLLYFNVSRETILSNPIIGIGMGQFVLNLQNYSEIQYWQFQPVHNVFLLIFSELGIVGVFLFTLALWKLFHVKQYLPNPSSRYFVGLFLAYIFIGFFDHYLWDIQQGQILLWITFSVVLSKFK